MQRSQRDIGDSDECWCRYQHSKQGENYKHEHASYNVLQKYALYNFYNLRNIYLKFIEKLACTKKLIIIFVLPDRTLAINSYETSDMTF